jgi:putative ABC transport system permease protein
MAAKSLLANKVRSVLTMLGIIIGIAAVMSLVSVVQGFTNVQKEYYERMGTNRVNVYAYSYMSGGGDYSDEIAAYCETLSEYALGVSPNTQIWVDGVRYGTANTRNNSQLGSPPIYLGNEQFAVCNAFTLAEGRDLSYTDVKSYNQVVVIGAKLKEYLFSFKDAIGETITIGSVKFTVVGVYEPKDTSENEWYSYDYMCVIPQSMSRILNSNQPISQYVIKAKSSENTKIIIDLMTQYLERIIDTNTGSFYVYSDQQWIDETEAQYKIYSLVGGGIAGISLLVGGIGIMNIMLVTVRERTHEIGIRKAIGGARRSILAQFLIEAAVVCGTGGIIGIIVGFLGTVVAGKLILKTLLLPSAVMTIFAAAFSVFLGLIFGMYPAVKASGLQPVDALRAD